MRTYHIEGIIQKIKREREKINTHTHIMIQSVGRVSWETGRKAGCLCMLHALKFSLISLYVLSSVSRLVVLTG